MRRPLPIPSFDEYVVLHKGIKAALSSSPGATDALHGARRHWGCAVSLNLSIHPKAQFEPRLCYACKRRA